MPRFDGAGSVARNRIRVGQGLVGQPALPVAEPDGEEPFVLKDSIKIVVQLDLGIRRQEIDEGSFDLYNRWLLQLVTLREKGLIAAN